MTTLENNIRVQMRKHRFTSVHIDRELGFPDGTMAQKLHRNKKNIEHGFTVSDIARLCSLIGCTCTELFKDVDFSKDTK